MLTCLKWMLSKFSSKMSRFCFEQKRVSLKINLLLSNFLYCLPPSMIILGLCSHPPLMFQPTLCPFQSETSSASLAPVCVLQTALKVKQRVRTYSHHTSFPINRSVVHSDHMAAGFTLLLPSHIDTCRAKQQFQQPFS